MFWHASSLSLFHTFLLLVISFLYLKVFLRLLKFCETNENSKNFIIPVSCDATMRTWKSRYFNPWEIILTLPWFASSTVSNRLFVLVLCSKWLDEVTFRKLFSDWRGETDRSHLRSQLTVFFVLYEVWTFIVVKSLVRRMAYILGSQMEGWFTFLAFFIS